jgi:hypothetical protein
MDAYCAEICKLEKNFQGLEILHVLHDSNVAADILAKLALERAEVPPCVFIEELSALKSAKLPNTHLFPSLQIRSCITYRLDLDITKDRVI